MDGGGDCVDVDTGGQTNGETDQGDRSLDEHIDARGKGMSVRKMSPNWKCEDFGELLLLSGCVVGREQVHKRAQPVRSLPRAEGSH